MQWNQRRDLFACSVLGWSSKLSDTSFLGTGLWGPYLTPTRTHSQLSSLSFLNYIWLAINKITRIFIGLFGFLFFLLIRYKWEYLQNGWAIECSLFPEHFTPIIHFLIIFIPLLAIIFFVNILKAKLAGLVLEPYPVHRLPLFIRCKALAKERVWGMFEQVAGFGWAVCSWQLQRSHLT